jgi:GTP-binding protein EngB required for normal cell division
MSARRSVTASAEAVAASTSDWPPVHAVTAALDTLVELGPGRLEDPDVATAAALRARIDQRSALGDGLTVIAVGGGTGVGKSALVNQLVGREVAPEGVRRPTTGRPLAIAGTLDGPTHALLDWLEIDDRRAVPDAFPPGMVLVDLPDHDSVVEDHRLTSARLARRVDALVVVVDPLKYARADLHHGPLAELTEHAEVVTVVLNRIDELPPAEVARCVTDLREQLARSGHPGAEPLTTSARTGAGIAALRYQLIRLVTERTAATRRLTADASHLALDLSARLPVIDASHLNPDALSAPLVEATDGYRVIAEAELSYRRDARAGIRSPLAWVTRAPFVGAGAVARSFGIGDRRPEPATRTSSAARIEAVLASEVQLAESVGPVHAALAATVTRTASDAAPALADAVDGVGLRPSPRRWWRLLAWLRGAAELTLLIGLVWLVLLGIGDWLQLPEIPTPMVTEVLAWPTVLFVGGLLVRVVLGLLCRWLIGLGARRHRREVEARLRRRFAAVLRDHVIRPYEQELTNHRRLQAAVAELARQP